MKITDVLRTEHKIFLTVFKQIEAALPSLVSPMEIQTMARVVEGLLREHAQRETHLAFVALDHVRTEGGAVSTMHQEHREIDARLIQVHRAATCAEARRLLKAAIISSREHFLMEEKSVFPLMESSISAQTLTEMGAAWLNGHNDPKSLQESARLG